MLAAPGGEGLADQGLAVLRGQLADIILGGIFLFMGLAACSIAAIRRRAGVRLFLWLGIWSALYGAGMLVRSPALVSALPRALQISVPYIDIAAAFLPVVVGLLSFFELSLGRFRIVITILLLAGAVIAVAAFAWFLAGNSPGALIPYNNLVASVGLLLLAAVAGIKRLSNKFLILLNRRVLAFGTLVFAVEGLWANLARYLRVPTVPILDPLAFLVFLLSFAYVAIEKSSANERRLQAIENELEIARQLQFSILPGSVPEIANTKIAVAYRPMTEVAGDFYEFVPVDRNRVGFLVADVTGHGVPAALIASMIKVAMQSVAASAHDPGEVLRQMNRILFRQIGNEFASAAYLWLDSENRKAVYSAAGHPPLIRWREGTLERMESNGLLFGIVAEADYPVCELRVQPGDRFLLYTDGVIEPESANGDSFGDNRLEQVLRDQQSRPPTEVVDRVLREVQLWQPAALVQQDDITLIVIDVS
jgi:phosphoserine phosphatase RsbU/P